VFGKEVQGEFEVSLVKNLARFYYRQSQKIKGNYFIDLVTIWQYVSAYAIIRSRQNKVSLFNNTV
jgi:hypothetical protein